MATPTGEFAYIDWLRQRTPADPRVLIGPGDDAAALQLAPGLPLLLTTDMLLDGSCFLLQEAGPRAVGRKAMAVNLSDIAAMAGVPAAAVVSVGLPHNGGRELAEELYHGLREMADRFTTWNEVTGTALLLGLATPIFIALSWLTERRRRN